MTLCWVELLACCHITCVDFVLVLVLADRLRHSDISTNYHLHFSGLMTPVARVGHESINTLPTGGFETPLSNFVGYMVAWAQPCSDSRFFAPHPRR